MRVIISVFILAVLASSSAKNCPSKRMNSKLFCYYSKLADVNCYCTHAILPANADVKAIDRAREQIKGVKILITVNEFNQGLVDLIKNSKVDGLEINLKKLDSKNDINDFISIVKSKLGSDLYLVLSVPPKAEVLAKYYDFKSLSKYADLFILQTSFLGASKNVTFHPSRLSGIWDMQNTDSVVDLVTGMGAPLSKLVITAPVQAFYFTLQNGEYTAPGSPALEVKSLTRNQLCNKMTGGANWTLERDQDQAGPYIFSKDQWIAFEDSTSMDIKAKYSRVRGLAGMALKDVSQDGGDKCGPSILESAYNGLSRQARAPRGAVLHSLEREILETPSRPLDSVQVSPYRISRVIDVEGKWHSIRHDTRTEFECSRQGYFVHPRSCNRFYRCVKFDQLTDEYSVFEFDCPAGLAFDERVEVCVWPGSLPHGTPCSGSSEIAPVPKQRFICPTEPGYYADPENCRWFFACLDHGKSPLSAYEFRCPFGLVFDSERLLCEWPWLVPKCGSGSGLGINLPSEFVYGGYSSGHGTGVLLEQYDGLGALGAVKLGGITGKIEQPVAKLYSNVGTAGLGYQNGAYINQNGYITGNGLGVNAAQSLQNAGLLKTNLVSGPTQYYHGNLQGAVLSGANGHINNQYTSGAVQLNENLNQQYSGLGGGLGLSGAGGLGSDNLDIYRLGEGNAANVNLAGAYGIKTAHISGTGQGGISETNHYQANLGSNLGYNVNANGANTFAAQHGLNSIHQANRDYNQGNAFGAKIGINNIEGGLQTDQYQGNLGSNLDYNAGIANDFGAKSSQSFVQYHGQTSLNQGQDLGANLESNSAHAFGEGKAVYQANLGPNLNYNAAIGNAFGATQYKEQNGQVALQNIDLNQGQNTDYNRGANFYNTAQAGATSSQSFTQYHDGINSQGVAGNINIVGGGYSAVGATKSDVQINNNGEDVNIIEHATPSPIPITTFSSVPTVTSVPIPTLKTASGFESYNGGVIANVPELQYRVQGNTGIANISANFVKFISSTASTVLVNGAFDYQKPAVVFGQKESNSQYNANGGTSYSYQSLDTSGNKGGYVYSKPSVAFEDGQINALNQGVVATFGYRGSSTIKPTLNTVEQNVVFPTVSVKNTEGYVYTKPNVAFEETPVKTTSSFGFSTPTTAKPITIQPTVQVRPFVPVQQIVPVQPVTYQPAISSYNFQRQDSVSGTYNYDKPSVVFGAKQPQVIVPSGPIIEQKPQIYVSSTVAPIVDQKIQEPAVSSYSFTQHVGSEGYNYPKPSVTFEEKPYIQPVQRVQPAVISRFSIRKPTIQPTYATYKEVQPAAVTSYNIQQPIAVSKSVVQPTIATYSYEQEYKSQGYQYPKPSVSFEEKPAPVSFINYQQPTQKTIIENYALQQPAVRYGAVQPAYVYQKPAVTSYTYQDVTQKGAGLYQPAVVSSYNYVAPSTPRPIQPAYGYKKPAVTSYTYQNIAQKSVGVYQPASVSSYSYVAPSTPKPNVILQQPVVSTYTYNAPSTVRPAVVVQKQPVVSTYTYNAPSTVRPAVVVQNQPVVSTYTYNAPSTVRPAVVVQKQPAVVSSYSYVAPSKSKPDVSVQNVEFGGYDYPKPSVSFAEEPTPVVTSYENRQPVEEVPFVKKTAYVTGQANSYQYNQNSGYKQATPVVIENYQAPRPSENYGKVNANVYSQSVDTSSAYFINNAGAVSSTPSYQQEYYSTPVYQEPVKQVYVQSTPRPSYKSTIASVLAAKVEPVTQPPNFYIYDSRLSSTPKTNVEGYSYPKPNVVFEENPIQPVVSTTYLPAVTPTREYLPAQTVTTSRPIARYSFSSLDAQYQHVSTPSPFVISSTTPLAQEYLPVRSRVEVTTPEPAFVVPEISTTAQAYVPVRSRIRYTTTGSPLEVTNPEREYLPVRSRVRITTSAPIVLPSTTYLPTRRVKITTTGAPVEVTTLSRDYLPVRSRVRLTSTSSPIDEAYYGEKRPAKVTIIKQNDFHPLLAAKLGAQCTCVSNTLKLRKKQKIIIVEDDDEDDDGYVVANNDQGGVVVENYQYNPQETVDITPTPQIYLKSTTNEIVPAPTPTYGIRKRVRVRPVTSTVAYEPVTEAVELFVKNDVTPVDVSDREIANAVRTGLKLVKQAAKEGAKEGTEEIISQYGPGIGHANVRGGIECQRAGLFRHPNQCNKFYACRWDCTKNKFTLHSFNCPVHLTFDNSLGACNWPSQGPACLENTLLPSE